MSLRPEYARDFNGGAQNFPKTDTLLLPYQAKWVQDSSRLKIAEKSRQIGWTWATAYGLIRRKGLKTARLDAWISSRDDIQARLFLEDCKSFADILNTGAKDLGEKVVDDKGNSAYVLSMANGIRIHSMSSNPDAQAGKRGDRVLDEFGLHPDPRKLYAIAYPGITWGGSMEIFSTHRGSANFFNELINEIKHKGNPKGFSLHRITLQDALDQGFLYKLQCKLPADDQRQAMDEAAYFDFIKAGCVDEESFLQEYMCIPADDNAAFISYDLLNTCKLQGPDSALLLSVEPTVDFSGRKGIIRVLSRYDLDAAARLGVPLYLGVDVGRNHDLTVLWLAMRVGGSLFPVIIVEMENVEFERQEIELYSLLSLPMLMRAAIDNTGIGKQFCERAQKKFGQYKVEAVTFTGEIKEKLAYPVRMGFEDRSLRIPDDAKIIADLRAIKKETTSAGNIRFTADRGKNGHADRFWSLALMVHAATGGPSGPTWAESEPVPETVSGLEKFFGEVDFDRF